MTQKNKSAVIDGQIHIDDLFAEEKAAERRKAQEGKRVAPLAENPMQPRRKSIFDDDEAPIVKKNAKPKPQTSSRSLFDEPEAKPKKPRESVSEPKIKMPEKKTAQKKQRESVSEPKIKMPDKKPRESVSEPKIRMPEKKSRESVSEPKLRLPEKKPIQKQCGNDTVKPRKPRPSTQTPAQSERRSPSARREAGFAAKPKASRTSASDSRAKPKSKARYAEPKVKLPPRKPDYAGEAAPRKKTQKSQSAKKPAASKAARPAPIKTGRGGARMSDAQRRAANARRRQSYSYSERETFAEKHLRSIIAMCLLIAFICGFAAWGRLTESGMRTFAQFGVGGTQGYILLGDDCMEYGNYPRAVEHYYNALSKEASYEAAIKLARAYSKTGDIERESGALLYCIDKYPSQSEAGERLTALYPDPNTRPTKVTEALNAVRR